MLMTLLFVALTAAQSGSMTLVAASLAIAAVAAVRIAATPHGNAEIAVGARAHAHREVLSEMTAPQHPDTAGRTRSRAPAKAALAA